MKIVKKFFKFLKLFYESYNPKKSNKYKFAFIVHPRNIKDAHREFPFFRILPPKILEKLINKLPPLIVSEITGLRSLNSEKNI
ncbi:MAG: hypothetical protein NZ866_01680 [Patescibacteria group bacterium]|nr:hypothetical protein [Patescibacteria group bacterium]